MWSERGWESLECKSGSVYPAYRYGIGLAALPGGVVVAPKSNRKPLPCLCLCFFLFSFSLCRSSPSPRCAYPPTYPLRIFPPQTFSIEFRYFVRSR